VAELTGAHAPKRFQPRGLDGGGGNEEGAQGIITVVSEGGRTVWFGLAVGRRWRRPLVHDREDLKAQRRRNECGFGRGGGRERCSTLI
jgi:hypothetical protein